MSGEKVVIVTFPGETRTVECRYHADMTDEQNIREWEQGWSRPGEPDMEGVKARVAEKAAS